MTPQDQRVTIIGIDWATKPKNVGLAFASVRPGRCKLEKVKGDIKKRPRILELIRDELKSNVPVLLAIDAPLGWPVTLRDALSRHRAGEELRVEESKPSPLSVDAIRAEADQLFGRANDLKMKPHPMEIGADRIARTAHSALRLLNELRGQDAHSLPLGWEPGLPEWSQVIEVYPVATMNAYQEFNYKRDDNRGKTLKFLQGKLGPKVAALDNEPRNEHVLDAVICVLAGFDFIQKEEVSMPEEGTDFMREGFIWVRNAKP